MEGGSSFLQTLSGAVTRFLKVYVAVLPDTTVVTGSLDRQTKWTNTKMFFCFILPAVLSDLRQALGERLIQLFVRHAALIRPLSEEGKLKLTQDLAQVRHASPYSPHHPSLPRERATYTQKMSHNAPVA